MQQLPLFPLKLYLLPGGISQLRIFEPRYTRLVKLAMTTGEGFGLCMIEHEQICRFGTRVVITDFETLDDGFLGITVEAVDKFVITDYQQDNDGLYMANIETFPNWPNASVDFSDNDLVESLKAVFIEYPEHSAHYPAPQFDNISWVCQRWLEVLPLEINQKQWFISRSDHLPAVSFLHSVINETNTDH
ncbi:TPA: LON peptidase substrate-binding domain-containing protein [Photobacterium damselae]|uniref:ATP-dependent protease n=4 Tax=Photobacterium damselae TaxID=38293 RepID=A0A2T3I5Q0_PHODM|nr:LON peptidase substrate-binding domain-containing protein [Photobacterium damselae]ARR49061.1 ATP-dependent protease [Photobacterium damselae subsp. damselae]EEZ41268.1 hypothetical ATP-dependent protease La (LON) domain protein [Photobacterium damselae subsp. damselae CIP 102761]EHA1080199.1 ATP-dependent protease [Photobacterium damselae]ELV7517222.1 LON peptidase substrate-binding domain-containing protein [Photobacterium damselae]KAB1178844.1 ATP-dependent protease [Photobacterium damse